MSAVIDFVARRARLKRDAVYAEIDAAFGRRISDEILVEGQKREARQQARARKRREIEERRYKEVSPDPARPWDLPSGRDETVTTSLNKHFRDISEMLAENEPECALKRLQHCARLLRNNLQIAKKRHAAITAVLRGQRRAELEAERREREREAIEKEEQRLARERERAGRAVEREVAQEGGAA